MFFANFCGQNHQTPWSVSACRLIRQCAASFPNKVVLNADDDFLHNDHFLYNDDFRCNDDFLDDDDDFYECRMKVARPSRTGRCGMLMLRGRHLSTAPHTRDRRNVLSQFL